jgi:hypothetical protein
MHTPIQYCTEDDLVITATVESIDGVKDTSFFIFEGNTITVEGAEANNEGNYLVTVSATIKDFTSLRNDEVTTTPFTLSIKGGCVISQPANPPNVLYLIGVESSLVQQSVDIFQCTTCSDSQDNRILYSMEVVSDQNSTFILFDSTTRLLDWSQAVVTDAGDYLVTITAEIQ